MKIPARIQRYIIESQTHPLKGAPFYIKILALVYRLLGRKMLAKLFITSERCDGCGRCVKLCPHNAITFRLNNPRRNKKCRGCLVCVHACPKRAVELPLSIIIGALLLLFLPYDTYITGLLHLRRPPEPGLVNITVSLLLWSAGYVTAIFIFGKISFLLSAVPAVKKMRGHPVVRTIYRKIHPAVIFPVLVPREYVRNSGY